MLHVSIITPGETVFDGLAASLSLPTPDGEITILPHHIPLISAVVGGTAVVRRGAEEFVFAVTQGVIEVDGLTVRLLTQSADRAEELEEEAITRAKERAEKLMKERRSDEEGFAEALGALERELAKLKTVQRRAHRAHRR